MEITIIINLVYLVLALILYFVLKPGTFIKHSENIVYFAILLNFLFFGWYFGVEEIRSDLMNVLVVGKDSIDSQVYDSVFGTIESKRLSYVVPLLSAFLIPGLVNGLKNRRRNLLESGS